MDGTTNPIRFGDPQRNIIAAVRAFDGLVKGDEARLVIPCPKYIARQIEIVATRADRSRDVTIACCLHWGLPRLEQLPGIDQIRECRREVLESGGDGILWFEVNWFRVDGWNHGTDKLWARVSHEDSRWCTSLASQIGLHKGTVAVLAIIAVLIEIENLPHAARAQMFGELQVFRRKLRQRADSALQIWQATESAGAPGRRFTFEDILREEDE